MVSWVLDTNASSQLEQTFQDPRATWSGVAGHPDFLQVRHPSCDCWTFFFQGTHLLDRRSLDRKKKNAFSGPPDAKPVGSLSGFVHLTTKKSHGPTRSTVEELVLAAVQRDPECLAPRRVRFQRKPAQQHAPLESAGVCGHAWFPEVSQLECVFVFFFGGGAGGGAVVGVSGDLAPFRRCDAEKKRSEEV